MEIDPAGLDEPQVAEADRATAVSGDALHTPAQLCRQPLDRAAELARGALAGGGVRRRRRHRARAHPGAVAGREGPATTTAIPAMPIDPFTPRIVLRAMSFYVTTPIYYVNARAPPRPRVHDDRRRHPRPPHAPARRGRVLPHRHRRARRAGRAGGRARGRRRRASSPTATRRASRRWSPRIDASNDFFIRTTDPSHMRAGPGGHPARLRQRPRLRGHLRGLVLPALRRLQDRARARARQHLPDPQDPARARAARRTGSSGSRLPGARSSGSTRSGPTSCMPRLPLQRGARRSSSGGLQDVSLSRPKLKWGVPVPVGPEPGHLRLVRRAAQLLHGALATRARART